MWAKLASGDMSPPPTRGFNVLLKVRLNQIPLFSYLYFSVFPIFLNSSFVMHAMIFSDTVWACYEQLQLLCKRLCDLNIYQCHFCVPKIKLFRQATKNSVTSMICHPIQKRIDTAPHPSPSYPSHLPVLGPCSGSFRGASFPQNRTLPNPGTIGVKVLQQGRWTGGTASITCVISTVNKSISDYGNSTDRI